MDSRKEQLLITVLKISGIFEAYSKIYLKFLNILRQKYPNISKEKVDLILKEYSLDNLNKDIIKIYDEIFTVEDLNSIIQFYTTSVGQKIRGREVLEKLDKIQINWVIEFEKQFWEISKQKHEK